MPGNLGRLTTELEAVNILLEIIGESPVNTVDDSGVVDAVMARNTLREVSRDVQTRGWHWNTDENVVVTPSVPDGFLMLPDNTLEVLSTDPLVGLTYRGGKLWDRINNTFAFTSDVRVTIVRLLDFTDLPQVARGYITVRAGRIYQNRVVGSKELAGFNETDEVRASVTLLNHDARGRRATLLRTDNTVRGVTYRRMGWRL